MHPLEKMVQHYQTIDHLQFELLGNEGNLHQLLSRSRIQISIYSTTFFDALGMGVLNLSIQDYSPFADYAADMIKEQAALALAFDEDPVEKYLTQNMQENAQLDREYVYSEFDPTSLLDIL